MTTLRELSFMFGVAHLGMDEKGVYEWQRVLQQLNTFKKFCIGLKGIAVAVPYTAAVLLTAVMSGERRRLVGDVMRGYFNLPVAGSKLEVFSNEAPELKTCPLTGERTFGRALQRLLSDPVLAERVETMTLTQGRHEARIKFKVARKRKPDEVRFVRERDQGAVDSALIRDRSVGQRFGCLEGKEQCALI